MKKELPPNLSRRDLLRALLAMPAGLVLAACAGESAGNPTPEVVVQAQPTAEPPTQVPPTLANTQPPPTPTSAPVDTPTQAAPPATPTEAAPTAVAQVLQPTPACGDDDDDPTPPQTEGPYYTPNTPERASLLEPGMSGTRMVLTGYVLGTDCRPVARALLDFWHADDHGVYDNAGYILRGHQFTDEQGRYTLETIVPGLYPGRTRHFHVKVQAPNQPVLTTQLYFPDEPENGRDGIFQPELVMAVQDGAEGKVADFNFVLQL